MKKLIKIISIIFVLCLISGCTISKENDTTKKNKPKEEYSLISTDERLVFSKDDAYEIIYFEEEKIVKVETAIKYKTEEEAQRNYKIESKNAYYESINYFNNILVKEQLSTYWEDYKDLNKKDLKAYYEKAEYTYID